MDFPRRATRGSRARARPVGGSQRRNRGVLPKDGNSTSAEEAARGLPGSCRPGVCGQEAACRKISDTTHDCICPHDHSPPTGPGMRCPNRSTVPFTPSPIHNIIPPAGGAPELPGSPAAPHLLEISPVTGGPPFSAAKAHHNWSLLGWGGIAVFSAAFILVALVIGIYRRRALRARKHKVPRNLSKGPLGSELFLTNPQYELRQGQGAGHGQGAHHVEVLSSAALTLQENIGEGCFGKVYRGELLTPDGEVVTVAVKVLKESASREAEADFLREVDVMSSFQHPHILRLIGVLPREPHAVPSMVFEFMPYGDLTEVLRSSSRNPWTSPRPGLPVLTPEALVGVALQIAQGMCYLAAQHFVHRDLACRNCLVGHNLTVKIADFGMSRDVYTCDYYKMGGSRALPVRWMSPEALLYGRFTLESDVWSFGVVLWEVLTRGKLPYYGHSNEEAVKLILQGVLLQPPDSVDCPPAAVELMRCCWRSEPRDRLRFPEMCSRLEEALKSMRAADTADHWDLGDASETESRSGIGVTLPRPPAFTAFPALPDHLDLPELAEDLVVDLGYLGEPEELLDPDNYLLPRPPDPNRCHYMEPIAD